MGCCGTSASSICLARNAAGRLARRSQYRSKAGRVSIDSLNAVFTRFEDRRSVRHELLRLVSGIRDLGVTRQLAAFRPHPSLEGADERRHPDLSDRVPLGGAEAVDVALDGEDCVDPAHRLDRQGRLGHIGQHEQLAPPMPLRCHSTCCARGTSYGVLFVK